MNVAAYFATVVMVSDNGSHITMVVVSWWGSGSPKQASNCVGLSTHQAF